MRNPDEERKDAMMASLMGCGLSVPQTEHAERYLNGESDSCDLGIDAKTKLTNGEAISKIMERLEKHKQYETGGRYLNVLWQIFGISMVSVYRLASESRKFVSARERIALEATQAMVYKSFGYGKYNELLQISGDREVLRAAMKDTDKSAGGPDFSILTAMFYDGPQNKPWDGKPIGTARQAAQENKTLEKAVLGFLGGILGLSGGAGENRAAGDDGLYPGFESNEYTRKYPQEFKRYEEMFPEILNLLFYSGVPEPTLQAMKDFLREKDIRKPIPAQILSYTSVAVKALWPREGSYYLSYAAINYRLSPVIFQFLRIMLSGSLQAKVLEYMCLARFKSDMEPEIKRWRIDFQLDDKTLITWLATRWANLNPSAAADRAVSGKLLAFMTKENPDAYVQTIREAPTDVFQKLINAGKASGNTDFVRTRLEPLISADKTTFMQKVISQITPNGSEELKADVAAFLAGTKGIEAVLAREEKILALRRYQNLSGSVKDYVSTYGTDDFYRRCLALLGLMQSELSVLAFCGEFSYDFKADYFLAVLQMMEQGGLPILQRLKVGAMVYDSYRGKKEEKWSTLESYFSQMLAEHREETLLAFQNGNVTGRLLGIAILGKDAQTNKEELLKYAGESSKLVKEELVKVYAAHAEWTEDFLQMLKTSKKGAERELAASVLAAYSGIGEREEELRAVMEKEKSKKVIDLISAILEDGAGEGADGAGAVPGAMTAEAFIRECHKGGKKRALAWIYEQPMPEVHFAGSERAEAQAGEEQPSGAEADGANAKAASEEYLQAILLAYSSMFSPGVNKDVHVLSDKLDKTELAAYVETVYDRFMAQGAEAKKKWVLYAASIHGGVRMVPRLQRQINEWAENSRGAMAAEAVKALALSDAPTALLIVDGMARKYKFKQVRKAAQDAMLFAAKELGLTVEELADRIVPDLGFDERLERHFDYGTRSFTVRISPNLDVEVKDENGKKLKSLPAVAKSDDEAKATAALEEFKELKKQMKTTVKTQTVRLELAMSLDRKWTAENWKKLFVKNPLMHQFAISLIWGNYVDGKLTDTFRYLEDGTFNTVDEEEYELRDDGMIGLVHPLELGKETIDAWKEQLSDYEITQAVEQLDRPVFALTEEEKQARTLVRFGGKILNGLSLSGKMTGLGWTKGRPQDAGMYFSYFRKDPDAGYGAELHFSGAFAGDESDEVTVYEAVFYKAEDVDKSCGNSYGKPEGENHLVLSSVPVRYMSEIIYQLTKATASSTDTDENWNDER